MGISPLRRSSDSIYSPAPPNPDPANYVIQNSLQLDNYLILRIKYPGCTTFEGVKILVYENATLEQLQKQGTIDPHFSDNKAFLSPVARFAPDEKGWMRAYSFVLREIENAEYAKRENQSEGV